MSRSSPFMRVEFINPFISAATQVFTSMVQALDLIAKQTPDLVVTDWNMPNMNGLELVKAIREQTKSTIIVMVTTEAEKAKVIEAIQAGINDYIIKPFTSETFVDKMQKILKR